VNYFAPQDARNKGISVENTDPFRIKCAVFLVEKGKNHVQQSPRRNVFTLLGLSVWQACVEGCTHVMDMPCSSMMI
jgi:hypothetical protein